MLPGRCLLMFLTKASGEFELFYIYYTEVMKYDQVKDTVDL